MSNYRQYRVEVNGTTGPIQGYPGEQWERVAQAIEDRGGLARLYCRLVTDHGILPMLGDDRAGWLVLKDKVISPWDVLAEIEVR